MSVTLVQPDLHVHLLKIHYSTFGSDIALLCFSIKRDFRMHFLYDTLPTTIVLNEPRCEKTGLRGFRPGPTQTGLYSHRRWLEAWDFGFRKEEGFYYPCSENKGADQLRGYREADLRLCFAHMQKPVFSRSGSNVFPLDVTKVNAWKSWLRSIL